MYVGGAFVHRPAPRRSGHSPTYINSFCLFFSEFGLSLCPSHSLFPPLSFHPSLSLSQNQAPLPSLTTRPDLPSFFFLIFLFLLHLHFFFILVVEAASVRNSSQDGGHQEEDVDAEAG